MRVLRCCECVCYILTGHYVSFGSKVSPRTVGCVAMRSVVYF